MYKLYTSNTEVPIFSSHTQIHHLARPVGCTYLTLETPVQSCQDPTMTQEKPPLAEIGCTSLAAIREAEGGLRLVVTPVLLNRCIISLAI